MPQILILIMLAGAFQNSAPDLQALRGVVRDQTGAVLQGAIVELADEGECGHSDRLDGFTRRVHLRAVSPGTYTLKVQFEGFGLPRSACAWPAAEPPPSQNDRPRSGVTEAGSDRQRGRRRHRGRGKRQP